MNTLKNVVKKAIAVGSGTIMLGATIGAAAALDLNEYPAPFVKNGQFDGLIVVGEKAATSDVIGAIDIAASLQAASVVPTGDGGSSKTVLSGDVKAIGDSGDMLEIGEDIGDVTETLTDDDLEMLRGGSLTTAGGTTDFTQTLDLSVATADSGEVRLDEDNDDNIGMFLYYAENAVAFQYELEFTSGLESDVDSDDNADDLEDESIFMLGSYYTVVDTDLPSMQSMTLELIAGEVTDTLSQGETKTYTIDGKEYEVTVLAIGDSDDDSTVKFLVNGEVTDSMVDGDTETLTDGLEIGVRDIIEVTAYRETDPSSIVEFYLGANKLELTDTNFNNTALDGSVEANEENLEDVDIDLRATVTGTSPQPTDLELNSIVWRLSVDAADGTNVFIQQGAGLRENLDEPEGMLNPSWDIAFEGLSEPDSTEIRFLPQGDEAYDLEFTNRRGTTYRVPFIHAQTTAAGDATFGDEDDTLILYELSFNGTGNNLGTASSVDYPIDLDDYFVVTDMGNADSADDGDDTYVLQFNDVNEDDTEITLEELGGSEITGQYTGTLGTLAATPVNGTFTVGGKEFDFRMYEPTPGVYQLNVDLDNNDAFGAAANTPDMVDVVVRGGGILRLANATTPATANRVTLNTYADDLDSDVLQGVNITFTETADEVDVTLPATGLGTWYRETDSDADVQYAVNAYGTWFEKTDDTDESDTLTITYPSEQVEALVYVVGGDVQSSVSATGGATRVNPINVGAAVLDKDVNVDQDNMIVVGGPCVNTIAAELLDQANKASCGEGFTEGHAMIQLFDTGAHVALLVAGAEAADTVAASRVIAEYADYDLAGMEVDVVSSSGQNVQVMKK